MTLRTNRDTADPNNGCITCHGPGGVAGGVAVAISGPAGLNPNQLGVYTVTATITSAGRMGVAIAASDAGTPLSVPVGQRLALQAGTGELIHDANLGALPTAGSGSASYTFNYTMPSGAGVGTSHTLYAVSAVGIAGNWAYASNFIVRTRPTATSSVTPSNITAASVDLTWSGGGPEYRVVYKTGAVAPANETDGTVSDVGALTSATVSGLTASTQYSFAVFSKLSGAAVFSSSAAATTATTGASTAAARYVNAATGVNTGNCSVAANPCKTITYAMAQAVTGSPGDSVNVAPGTYNVALGEVFPIAFKSGVQLLVTSTQANTTIINASGANTRIFNVSAANAFSVIQGFILTGGFHQPPADGSNAEGGAIRIDNASAIKIRRNLFIDNEARGSNGVAVPSHPSGGEAYGGAIVSYGSSPTIENNLFYSNTVQGGNGVSKFDGTAPGTAGNARGGAVFLGGSGGIIINNTFVANEARGGQGGSTNGAFTGGQGGNGFSGALDTFAPSVNNLFANNVAAAGIGGGGSPAGGNGIAGAGALNDNYFGGGPSPTMNNLFFSNAPVGNDTLGDFALQTDPQFHSSSDFRIRLSSPARGNGRSAGAPAIDYYGVARPSLPTIGAFEATGLPTTTALASNANPSATGQSVTFTATVTSASGTPTGNVAFKDGSTTVCAAVTVVATQAQCVTSALSAGTHLMTAEYAGDGTFAASASTVLSQVVQSDPPRLGNISTRGQVLTGNDVMIGGFVI
ncbi:MAG TPA: Ig-like domain repeat protein, partial [Opitutaceae bacterium]|nr:Ig-like domain repeat protein [Opitutaceae bacterium]